MPTYESILPHLSGFVLVLSRLAGLFVFAPLVSSEMVPRQMKVLLAISLAVAIYPVIDHPSTIPARLDLYQLIPLMASELLIGLSIGIMATIPLMTAQLAGIMMGQQMGLGLAAVYNPAIDFEGDSLGQLLFYLALASYLAAGGLEIVFGTIMGTFDRVAIGGFALSDAPLDTLVGIVHSGFEIAVRMSMPVLLILLLETVAAGFIMKTVPSLNIMNIGFPIRILLGLLMLVSSLAISMEVLMSAIAEDLQAVQQWAGALDQKGGG